MANYKVGDLDVVINGVSKDAVSSLSEVIKELDALQGKLGVVSQGFSGAFNIRNISTTGITAVSTALDDIAQRTETVTNSQRVMMATIADAQKPTQQALSQTVEQFEELYMQYNRSLVKTPSKNQILELINQTNVELEKARQKAVKYRKDFVMLFGIATPQMREAGSRQFSGMINDIEKADGAVTQLEDKLSKLKLAFGNPFNEAQAQVSQLTNEMLNLHFATGNFDDASMQQISDLTNRINETNEAFKRLGMTERELVLYELQQENATRKQNIAYLEYMLASGKAGEKTREFKEELRKLIKEQYAADKAANKLSKGGLSVLINRISRIAFYRAIRRGLQIVTQTFVGSIQAYAQVDENINKMMTQLTSSTKIIQLSLGTIIFPILQSITPVVKELSVGFANMANTINASLAKINNLSTYTKINVQALQDYRKEINKTSGALFDFDKFRALSSGNDNNVSIFLQEAAVEDLNKEVGVSVAQWTVVYDILHNVGSILSDLLSLIGQIITAASPWLLIASSALDFVLRIASGLVSVLEKSGLLVPIMGAILTYLTIMGATKIITWLKSGSLVTWIKSATSATASFGKNLLSVLSTTQAMTIGIGALVGSISYFIQNFDELGATAKWLVPLIAGVTATVIGLTTALVAMYSAHLGIGAAIKAGITAAAISGAVALAVGTSIAKSIPKYANGASDIDGGAVFVAGEANKTEMVYSGDNGKANVANVQQMAQAMYSGCLAALKDYGAARGEMPQLQPASDTGIYQAASRGARKVGKTFNNL